MTFCILILRFVDLAKPFLGAYIRKYFVKTRLCGTTLIYPAGLAIPQKSRLDEEDEYGSPHVLDTSASKPKVY